MVMDLRLALVLDVSVPIDLANWKELLTAVAARLSIEGSHRSQCRRRRAPIMTFRSLPLRYRWHIISRLINAVVPSC